VLFKQIIYPFKADSVASSIICYGIIGLKSHKGDEYGKLSAWLPITRDLIFFFNNNFGKLKFPIA
jgi:hypothetical protein